MNIALFRTKELGGKHLIGVQGKGGKPCHIRIQFDVLLLQFGLVYLPFGKSVL